VFLAILLALAPLPIPAPLALQAEVCGELRPILPDLRRIDRMSGGSHRHVVSDARVRTLEAALGNYLGLPPGLRVQLTTISGHRREVAKNGSITAWIHHRSTGMDLGHAVIAWSGKYVDVSGLRFRMTEAESVESRPDHEGDRHFLKSDLVAFYRRLDELMEIVAPPVYPVERVFSFSGSARGVPPFGTATVAIRRPGAHGEKYFAVRVTLPLRERPVSPEVSEEPAAAWPDRPFAGPASRPVPVDASLDAGLEILDQLEFSFQHSIQLAHSHQEPLVYELRLDPYKRGHPPVSVTVHVRKGKDSDERWYVEDARGQLDREGVELRAFVLLMNAVVPILVQRGERIGVLGLAGRSEAGQPEALLVTVDAESIWSAQRGQLYVLRVSPEGEALVVRQDELPAIVPGEPAMHVRQARSSTDELLHLYVPVRGDIFMANPPPRELRYGDLSFAPVGGNLSN